MSKEVPEGLRREILLMPLYFYKRLKTSFGQMGLVWQETEKGPKVSKIYLPEHTIQIEDRIYRDFPKARPFICPLLKELGAKIQNFLEGRPENFELDNISLELCSPFQKSALLAEFKIPRGWVSTYGRIAEEISAPNGARAVGRALATNPFPLIIPCHRAIRSNGELGGFQGGLEMKEKLLRLEGINFSPEKKIIMEKVYY